MSGPESRGGEPQPPEEQPGGIPESGPGDEHIQDINEAEARSDDQGERENQAERDRQPAAAPSIWVGSWLDYNNGVLHGRWIDANQDEETLGETVRDILADSPTARDTSEVAEDWGIFDYEDFGPLRIGEQESLSWVSAVARGIAEHGLAFAAYADVMEEADALAGFQDSYLGHYQSLTGYAEQLVADADYEHVLDEQLPESIRPYVRIDAAALARDLLAGGEIHVLDDQDGGVWVFRSE